MNETPEADRLGSRAAVPELRNPALSRVSTFAMHYLALLILLGAVSCGRCKSDNEAKPESKSAHGSAAVRRPVTKATRRNWAPPPPPSLPSLASAWSAAEAKKTAEAWDFAADAYERERAECVDDCLDAQYAVVLARKNAFSADPLPRPQPDEVPPLPPRVNALVKSLDDYVKMAPPTDPDLIDMKFLAANALNTWHQEEAIARLEQLLREYRNDPSAEYVANMLLAALTRANRVDQLKVWVGELLADAAFLAGKDQLRSTLETLHAQLAELGR